MSEMNKIELAPFELTLDLTDLSLERQQGSGKRWNQMPEGRYKVRINDCGVYTSKAGTNSVRFSVEITEGAYSGGLTDVYCGLKIDEVGTRLMWKRALASIGAPADALETNAFSVNADMFKGQDAFVDISVNAKKPTDEKGNTNFNRNFILASEYEAAPGPKAQASADGSVVTMQAPAQAATTPKWAPKMPAPAGAAAAPAVTMSVPKPKVGAAAMYGSMVGK